MKPKDGTIVIKPKNDKYRVCVNIADTKGNVDAVPLYGPYEDKAEAQAKARELTSNG